MNQSFLLLILVGVVCAACEPSQSPQPAQPTFDPRSIYLKLKKEVFPLLALGQYSQAHARLSADSSNLSSSSYEADLEYWLGECSMGLGHFQKAQSHFRHSYDIAFTLSLRARSMEGQARASYHLREYSEALELWSEINLRYSSYVDKERLLYNIYECSAELGDHQRSQNALRQLQSLYPQNGFLKKVGKAPSTVHTIPAPSDASNRHYLQCGIFSTKENASNLLKQLKWNGFSPFIIQKQGKHFVALGYYATSVEADLVRERLEKFGFKGIVKP